MTREQAINSMISHGFTVEQVGEIIKAVTPQFSSELDKNSKKLEKGTTKNDLGVDCISRKAALDITWHDPSYSDPLNVLTEVRDKIRELPSVTPQLSVPEVTALAEWTEKLTKASEDAYNKGYADGMKAQKPKTGKWIEHFDESGKWYECDQCHTDWGGAVNFCPDCGADMRGEK